jgi:hypothetical protein
MQDDPAIQDQAALARSWARQMGRQTGLIPDEQE